MGETVNIDIHQSQNGDAQDNLVPGKALPAYAKKGPQEGET